jgi:hypothetical protein
LGLHEAADTPGRDRPPVDRTPTHSAVVTEAGTIAGYNQESVFPRIGSNGLTYGSVADLGPNSRKCATISEDHIVRAAGYIRL